MLRHGCIVWVSDGQAQPRVDYYLSREEPTAACLEFGDPALPSLPLEVLETICSLLHVEDRIALASCCRSLQAQLSAAGGSAVWAEVTIRRGRPLSPSAAQSLAAWLAARKHTLQQLHLEGRLGCLQSLLKALQGGALRELAVCCNHSVGANPEAALASLGSLPSITRLELSVCGLKAVPAVVTTLPSLQCLSLAENWELGGGSGTKLQRLSQLSTLTSLDLSGCCLDRIPHSLPALPRLVELRLAHNFAGEPMVRGVRCLTALTRLDVCNCFLTRVPQELAGLARLAELVLAGNSLGRGGRGALDPLAHLSALSYIDLSRCPGVDVCLAMSLLPPKACLKWVA